MKKQKGLGIEDIVVLLNEERSEVSIQVGFGDYSKYTVTGVLGSHTETDVLIERMVGNFLSEHRNNKFVVPPIIIPSDIEDATTASNTVQVQRKRSPGERLDDIVHDLSGGIGKMKAATRLFAAYATQKISEEATLRHTRASEN